MVGVRNVRHQLVNGGCYDDRCHPYVNMVFFPFVLPPTVLTLFLGVHNMCLSEETMGTEGWLWFPDLLSTDSTYLLPVLSSLSWLWLVEVGTRTRRPCGVPNAA